MKKINAFDVQEELFTLWQKISFPVFGKGKKESAAFFLSLILIAFGLAVATPAAAQTQILSSTAPSAFTLNAGTYGSGSIVAVSGQPFTQAWFVSISSNENNPTNTTLSAPLASSANVVAGDLIVASFWTASNSATGPEININARFEQAASPYADSIVIPIRGRQQWRQVSVPFIANANYTGSQAKFYFQISTQRQQVWISGVTLTDYGQKSVFGNGILDATSFFSFNGSADATDSTVSVSGNPFFTTASHIAVTSNPNQDSYVNLAATVPHAVTAGDTMIAFFWVHDADTTVKNAVVGFSTQNATGVTNVSYSQGSLIVDGNWKEHIVPFTVPTTYAANGMKFVVKCSAQLQTVEYGGLQLMDLGSSVSPASLTSTLCDYPGRLITDSWRTDANARIAANRMGNLTIDVTNSSDAAIGSVPLTVAMQKHLFGFGTAVGAAELTTATGTDATTYRSTVASLFNKAVFDSDMKWIQWETVSGDPTLVTNAFTWLHNNNIYDIRGQNLIWPSWTYTPTDLPGLSASGGLSSPLETRVTGHIDSESEYTGIKYYMSDWDVCNEPYTNHSVIDKLNGITSGRGTVAQDASVLTAWYQEALADDAFPYAFLNDNGVSDNPTQINNTRLAYNYSLLQDLITDGAPIDGFGFESHFAAGIPTPPLTVKAVFDQFAALTTTSGQPLREQVTEFDQNTTDQVLQADYLSDYMTMVFSEPNFDAFVMWGFWDTKSWIGNAPLYTANWTLKPSGEAWKGLVFGQWWTNASVTANASGTATVNGYLGRYAVTGTNGGITKIYYADLPTTSGATLTVKLAGTSGTSHVWLYEANRSVIYTPFENSYDPQSYDTGCVTSPTGSGNATAANTGYLRVDTEASGTVNIWMRVRTPSGGGAFWVGINSASPTLFSIANQSGWKWIKFGQTTLTAGAANGIKLWDAIGATKLDQVLLTDDLNFNPQ